ncbi:MAG: fibronectin type III domain-containing protein [Prevotellaceae bacterium]|jgi:hypothetical protein|nr:fibronectin type III domain-containing protein [Prevotellaceae bacterium]
MKKSNQFLFAALVAAFLSVANYAAAQVTIGGSDLPKAGTIVDLNPQNGVKGGLALSNVYLTDLEKIPVGDNLFPGIDETNNDVNPNLTGAIVYNTNEWLYPSSIGLYAWDGNKWNYIGGSGFSTPLVAPSNLAVTITGQETVRLTWIASPTAGATYELERKLGDAASTNDYTVIAFPAAGVITYDDSGLIVGEIYTWRLRAVKYNFYSGYTNDASNFLSFAGPFSNETGSGGSVIDLIKTNKSVSYLNIQLNLTSGEDVSYTSTTDVGVGGLVLTKNTTSPTVLTIDGGGKVIDLTGTAPTTAAPFITVNDGVTLTLKNITFKGLKSGATSGETDNTAPVIHVNGGTLVMGAGAAIKDNTDGESGVGGVYVSSGTFTMQSGATISGNKGIGGNGGNGGGDAGNASAGADPGAGGGGGGRGGVGWGAGNGGEGGAGGLPGYAGAHGSTATGGSPNGGKHDGGQEGGTSTGHGTGGGAAGGAGGSSSGSKSCAHGGGGGGGGGAGGPGTGGVYVASGSTFKIETGAVISGNTGKGGNGGNGGNGFEGGSCGSNNGGSGGNGGVGGRGVGGVYKASGGTFTNNGTVTSNTGTGGTGGAGGTRGDKGSASNGANGSAGAASNDVYTQ